VGNSATANEERAQLSSKQQTLEKERLELVTKYEREITELRTKNLEY